MPPRLEVVEGSSFFAPPKTNHQFIHSGCVLLDCVLGGGWPLGRISNIVGDKSTSKTGLSIEACSNFARQFPTGRIFYRETEAAFDIDYAERMGLPVSRVEFTPQGQLHTVEDFFEDLTAILDELKNKTQALYILDSLDALSDRSELKRDIDEGSYGAAKAKKLSELFRRLVQKLEDSNICLIIVSQVRDNIGVTWGPSYSRSGGRALDFYASIVVYLAKLKNIERQVKGVKRPTGIEIRAKCTKNKIALPMRECDFEYEFGFGINSLKACVEWLKDVKRLKDAGIESAESFIQYTNNLNDDQYWGEVRNLEEEVKTIWYDIEKGFMPTRRKYNGS
jgi:recombination protein RecA